MKSPATTLLHRLEGAGYFAAYGLLGDGNFRPYDWEKMAGGLEGETQALWKFFLLGTALPESRLRRLLGSPGLSFLKQLKLCRSTKDGLTLGTLSLITYRSAVFFVDRGNQGRTYFGEDTKALMSLLPRSGQGRCLCLYARSGVSVLPLAAGSPMETAFSRGRYSREVIRANLALNEAQGEVRFLASAAQENKVAYDVIVAAPPSAFVPVGVKMPETIAGGRDGFAHVQDVLGKAGGGLASGGTLAMTFMFFSTADSKAMQEKLRAQLDRHALDYSLILCAKHLMQPGVPLFNMIFSAATAGRAAAAESIAKKLLRHVRNRKLEAGYLIKGRFFPSARPSRREISDFSDLYYGSWTF